MRKALWALGLLAASFAGGAVLNGPGVRWARSIVHGRNGGADPIPILDDELRRSGAGLPPLAKADTPSPPEPDEPPTGHGVAPTLPPTRIVEAPPSPTAPEPQKMKAWVDAPGSAPATRQEPPARLDAGVVPAGIPELATSPPEPLEEPAMPAAKPAPSKAAGGWEAIKKSMRDLGVTRYWVEGTAEGRSTFRCIVPIAGKRAVAQQFEAEADDPMAAAESALRRVALWQAAETP